MYQVSSQKTAWQQVLMFCCCQLHRWVSCLWIMTSRLMMSPPPAENLT
jgi:hypothetical protein